MREVVLRILKQQHGARRTSERARLMCFSSEAGSQKNGWWAGMVSRSGMVFDDIQSSEPVERAEAKRRAKSQYAGTAIIRLSE
ncbi:hypothetical protein DRP05_00855 [Archaeoglobales archaeon]|nr:MAG: hypothetical protein DRP05_00855 [Archaeoglobales archaeon]